MRHQPQARCRESRRRGDLLQDLAGRGAVAVDAAGLLVQNLAGLVQNERGRIGRFVRRVPAQTVKIGRLVGQVGHECDVCWQCGLLCEEFLSVLIEFRRRTWIDKHDGRFLSSKFRGVRYEIMSLLLEKGALITGVTPKKNKHGGAFL